jgi:L-threonylcarbamoyladenylate synthase
VVPRTRRLSADDAGVREAAATLQAGGLVAFPTETVYGLGANALDAAAVAGIFRAKDRPASDPLIVHLADPTNLELVARISERGAALAARFWPGPLTLVLPRRDVLPASVTAGRDTVAVRVPSHPLAHAVIAAAGVPVAAPSANLFGRPSPTRAEHVLEDLDGRIDAILDGGPATIGVESTIVDLAQAEPRLLRPGGLPSELIEAVLGRPLLPPPVSSGEEQPQLAPGLLPSHYAPLTPLVLVTGVDAQRRLVAEVRSAVAAGQRVGIVLVDEDRRALRGPGLTSIAIGSQADPRLLAQRLFEAVRALDRARLDVLYVRELGNPSEGLGRALADRLRRAAARVVTT